MSGELDIKLKKDSKLKGSFLSLLLRNYILFTLLLVIGGLCLLYLAVSIVSAEEFKMFPGNVWWDMEEVQHGHYDSAERKEFLGDGGYIVVLNEAGQVVYKSRPELSDPVFTQAEISYIPDYRNFPYVYVEEFDNAKGERQIVVHIQMIDDTGMILRREWIFDEVYNILYQPELTDATRLTPKEFGLLSDTYDTNYSLMRYPFQTQSNENYTMLLYKSRDNQSYLSRRIDRVNQLVFVAFILLYCILIGAFIFWLNRKVKKPLRMLHTALVSFSKGERQLYLNYKGPREFEEICDSFNEMSQMLYNSEHERVKLQEEQQKMLADISHDLKTPITVIQGYAKAVSDGLVPPENQAQYLTTISQKADVLNDLINTFYEYSKMEHPDYQLTLEVCDICILTGLYGRKIQ
jgi:hypothetical protein